LRASVSGLMALLVLWFFPLNIFIHSFKLLNEEVISEQERQFVEVPAQVLCDLCWFNIMLSRFTHVALLLSLSLLHEFTVYSLLPLNRSITVYW